MSLGRMAIARNDVVRAFIPSHRAHKRFAQSLRPALGSLETILQENNASSAVDSYDHQVQVIRANLEKLCCSDKSRQLGSLFAASGFRTTTNSGHSEAQIAAWSRVRDTNEERHQVLGREVDPSIKQRIDGKTLSWGLNWALVKLDPGKSLSSYTGMPGVGVDIPGHAKTRQYCNIRPDRTYNVAKHGRTIEKYERGNEILQIGFVMIDLNAKSLDLSHFVVKEHLKLRNTISGTVSSHRLAYNGTSAMVSLDDALRTLSDAVICARQGRAGVMVGHSLRIADLPWLQSAGVNFDGLAVLDIAEIEKAFLPTHEPMGLERLALVIHGIKFCGQAHVVGNDAAVTVLVLASQLGLCIKYELR